MQAQPQPFEIAVPQASLDDLEQRLRNTRWPDASQSNGWKYGTDDAYLRELVDYWIDGYDWRAQETAMNRWPHFKADLEHTSADGVNLSVPVHFIHERGKGPNPIPLIATHGWPWTFWDLAEIIGPLTDPAAYGGDPADSFDLVVPSLPGFGFSTPLPTGHLSTADIAQLWVTLMTDTLGYGKFCAQGGDWGAIVSTELGHAHAESVHGIAITLPNFPGASRTHHDASDLLPGEEDYAERTATRLETARSHVAVMGTDPQTLAHALHDSPVGLLSWMVERRRNWSDCANPDGSRDIERRFSKDDLLTLVSLFWHTESFWSSARLYYARFHDGWEAQHDRSPLIEAPTAMAVFPGDLIFIPRKVAEKVANVQRWEHMPAGGHFAPAEEPELVVHEVREFFRQFR